MLGFSFYFTGITLGLTTKISITDQSLPNVSDERPTSRTFSTIAGLSTLGQTPTSTSTQPGVGDPSTAKKGLCCFYNLNFHI